jgi:hypothetical protein
VGAAVLLNLNSFPRKRRLSRARRADDDQARNPLAVPLVFGEARLRVFRNAVADNIPAFAKNVFLRVSVSSFSLGHGFSSDLPLSDALQQAAREFVLGYKHVDDDFGVEAGAV